MSGDLYHDAFRWHERLLALPVEPDRLLLASETESWLHAWPGIARLAGLLQHGGSLAAHCREDSSAPLAMMLHALQALHELGHVQRCDGAVPCHAAPDTAAPVVRQRIGGDDDVEVICLSVGVSAQAALRWTQAALGHPPQPLSLVFCDDLLDPRLEAIDRAQRQQRRAWLPLKATGEAALIGPLFAPAAAQAACWRCLADRLLRNQPARAWWQAQRGAWPGAPVRCDAAWVAGRLAALQPLLPQVLARPAHRQQLLSIEAGIAEPQAHAVMRRPQCPACGNPALAAQPQGRPFMPARRPMAAHAGWRSMPPADTVARLQPLVSPLCGVVSHLAPLTPQPGSDDGPWVFRSGFFKTPPADGAPLAAALHQVCLGKGLSAAASRASALCEAVERHAAFYQGDEACIEGPPEALDAPCILPAALTPHRPSVQTADMPRRWVPAWSLTRQARCYLPLGLCYAHAPAEDARHIGWTSNGCAAGNTLEEAVLQGLLELVERDAVARWWYARVERPAVPSGGHGTLPWPQVDQALGPGWERWLLDLTHDLGIPVAAAVAHHHASGGWAAGFGCGLSMAQACERALTELVQLVAAGKRMPTPPDEADAQRFLLPAAGIAAAPHAAIGQADIAGAIDHCVRAASAHGLETIVLDYSRPDLPLHTAKVVVPGLSHIWPGHTTDRIGRLQNPQALYV